MELWIRSQDREKLVKTTRLALTASNLTIYGSDIGILGTYNTKERALEVLEEIQRTIITPAAIVQMCDGIYELKESSKFYEMPKK